MRASDRLRMAGAYVGGALVAGSLSLGLDLVTGESYRGLPPTAVALAPLAVLFLALDPQSGSHDRVPLAETVALLAAAASAVVLGVDRVAVWRIGRWATLVVGLSAAVLHPLAWRYWYGKGSAPRADPRNGG